MIASYYRSRILLESSHARRHITLYISVNKRHQIRGILGANSAHQHHVPRCYHYSTGEGGHRVFSCTFWMAVKPLTRPDLWEINNLLLTQSFLKENFYLGSNNNNNNSNEDHPRAACYSYDATYL